MKSVNDDLEYQYNCSVDEWVLGAIQCGISSFEELILSLPSVYPTVAVDSLKRLTAAQKITGRVADTITKTICQAPSNRNDLRVAISQENRLPFPHPLDFDWRFSTDAIHYLSKLCLECTKAGDHVALLGVPSVVQVTSDLMFLRQVVLLDANLTLTTALTKAIPAIGIQHCDLLKDPLPKIEAQAIILDPPWYEEYFHAFMWAANQLCAVNGTILASLPPVGTRPGIEQERSRLFEYTGTLNLVLTRLEQGSLPYASPPFESNALHALGVYGYPKYWRRGDLAIFSKTRTTTTSRPNLSLLAEAWWSEETIDTVRLRVRNPDGVNFDDPTLLPIIEGDILPSVSRRDLRRQSADVWSSGNRIFACRGRNVLYWILHAMAGKRPPEAEVEMRLQRSLTDEELSFIYRTQQQIIGLIKQEQHEYSI